MLALKWMHEVWAVAGFNKTTCYVSLVKIKTALSEFFSRSFSKLQYYSFFKSKKKLLQRHIILLLKNPFHFLCNREWKTTL